MAKTNLYKNGRLQQGCTGSIFFNPFKTISNIRVNTNSITPPVGGTHQFFFYEGDDNWEDVQVSDFDIMSFGGQFAGFAKRTTYGGLDVTTMYVPFGAYATTNISDLVNTYDTINVFKPIFDYGNSNPSTASWICNGVKEGETSNTDEANSVGNVRIQEVRVVKNNATYGHHSQVYNSKNTYEAKLLLPYGTSIEKVKQILQSSACVFMFDDRVVYDDYYSVYDIVKPLGGGCIDPLVRAITVTNAEVSEIVRRGAYEITAIFEG